MPTLQPQIKRWLTKSPLILPRWSSSSTWCKAPRLKKKILAKGVFVHIILQHACDRGVNFDQQNLNSSNVKKENVDSLKKFCSQVGGIIVPIENAQNLLNQFRTKAYPQRVYWKGLLEISDVLKIPINTFLKTMPQKFPLLEKISQVKPTKHETHNYFKRKQKIESHFICSSKFLLKKKKL